jgi:hypothetical protein
MLHNCYMKFLYLFSGTLFSVRLQIRAVTFRMAKVKIYSSCIEELNYELHLTHTGTKRHNLACCKVALTLKAYLHYTENRSKLVYFEDPKIYLAIKKA